MEPLLSPYIMSFFTMSFSATYLSMNGESISLQNLKQDWIWYILMFVGGHYYNFFEAKATSISKNPSIVSIIASFEIPLNYGIDLFLFGVEFSYVAFFGSLVVMASLLISIIFN